MFKNWKWMVAPTMAAAFWVSAPSQASAQPPKDAPKPPAELEKPHPIPEVTLLPVLPTTPLRKGGPSFNEHPVDASLLPRDNNPAGMWVLDFAFKPLRMITVDVPGKGRKQVYYLAYRVVNHTGKPREFVPQFTLIDDKGKRYEEAVLPKAVEVIRGREDYTIKRHGAVDIAGIIPPSTKEGVDEAVYGVAIWEGIDARSDSLKIYIRGLSDGWKDVAPPGGGKPVTKYKTLQIDLIRRGDHHDLHEKEIQLADPAYEWIYW